MDWVHHVSTIEVNPLVGNTGTTQEVECTTILRKLYRVQRNVRGPSVLDLDQSFRCEKINPGEDGSRHNRLAEIGSAEIGVTEIGSAEIGFSEVRFAEVRFFEDRFGKVSNVEIGSAEVCSAEVRSAEVRSAETCSAEVSACISDMTTIAAWGPSSTKFASGDSTTIGFPVEASSLVGFYADDASKCSTCEISECEVSISKISSAEVGFAEISTSKISLAEVGFAEIGSAEVGLYVLVVCSPCVPSNDSLLKKIEMLLLCHIVSSLILHITQQSLQGSLIGCLILPLMKIADTAYPADIARPGRVRLHGRVIESDRKELERPWWMTFSLEGQFHFPLHPIAHLG